jgi:hypothetical protein
LVRSLRERTKESGATNHAKESRYSKSSEANPHTNR